MNRNDYAIDPHKLDEEWLQQPILMEQATTHLADAIRQRDESRTSLDIISAEAANDIRSNPADYGLDKVTEAMVQEKMAINKEVIKAKRLLNTMQNGVQLAKNEVDIVDMKKRALENLVELYKAQYFSVPRERKEINSGKHTFSDDVREKTNTIHREKLKEAKQKRQQSESEPTVEIQEDESTASAVIKPPQEIVTAPAGRRRLRERSVESPPIEETESKVESTPQPVSTGLRRRR